MSSFFATSPPRVADHRLRRNARFSSNFVSVRHQRRRLSSPRSLKGRQQPICKLECLLPLEQTLHQLHRLVAFVTRVLEELVVLWGTAEDAKSHLPWLREDVGILDCRLVVDVVGIDDGESFDNVKRRTVE